MSGYQTTERDRIVTAESLRETVRAIFERCGMGGEDAALLTDSLVVADLRGVHSHGVLRVPEYVKKLTVDEVDPGGCPGVARIYAPGELEWETERRHRRDGIPLPVSTLADVAATARELGIAHTLPV